MLANSSPRPGRRLFQSVGHACLPAGSRGSPALNDLGWQAQRQKLARVGNLGTPTAHQLFTVIQVGLGNPGIRDLRRGLRVMRDGVGAFSLRAHGNASY